MFKCHTVKGTIPYTLVCDFQQDCHDESDEKYCNHRAPANGSLFKCENGQRITYAHKCDQVSDCFDSTDESGCIYTHNLYVMRHFRKRPPVIINFDGLGDFTQVSMASDTAPCPDTHFRCPGSAVYCMPVFVRCNGVNDCPGGQDELSCAEFTCPGFYRCRGSIVCVHSAHLCDGWPQCPQRDDELHCNRTCPSECGCQGLAFVCPRPFPAHSFPDLRYLDGVGSGITPSALAENVYLVYLRLADCRLDTWPNLTLRNLQTLVLSDNRIQTLYSHRLVRLVNLRSLDLKRNPLTNLVSEDPNIKQERLVTVDLSHTRLLEFNATSLAIFPFLTSINLSHSPVNSISEEGFALFPGLRKLDLTGCAVQDFRRDLFRGLNELSFIFASNYKLCCRVMLPDNFNPKLCIAPADEVSSCEDLLRSTFYRVFLWLISFLALLGNAGCIVVRLVFQRRSFSRSGYNLFVTSLSLTDFLMGVYLALVGATDQMYRGSYLWYDVTWKSSALCKVAGFLSLLSSEVSALTICLITLDRFIVLRFPFSTMRFKVRSAVAASVLAWLVGVLLAALPLLPALSHWRFYGQTGICIPLPVTRNSFLGRGYSFGVMIVFNFVLFVAIACGQVVIYLSIRANSMTSTGCITSNTSRDLTVARRLITVVVTDFLCWFPIGVLGLMAFHDVPVPGEVNVAMAIFVLPLNSALNPFLYTLNMVMEKRRRVQEERLRKFLLSHAAM